MDDDNDSRFNREARVSRRGGAEAQSPEVDGVVGGSKRFFDDNDEDALEEAAKRRASWGVVAPLVLKMTAD